MQLEVRHVAADWRHPTNPDGSFLPLFDRRASVAIAEWNEGLGLWMGGYTRTFDVDSDGAPMEVLSPIPEGCRLDLWGWIAFRGPRPDESDYMPDWTSRQATHLMLYEGILKGVPISPAFATAEELARWAVDNHIECFGGEPRYETWLSMIQTGEPELYLGHPPG